MFFYFFVNVDFYCVVLGIDGVGRVVLFFIFWLDLWFVCVRFLLYFVIVDGCEYVCYLEDEFDYDYWFNVIEDYDFYVSYVYFFFFVVFIRFGFVLVGVEYCNVNLVNVDL